MGRVASSFARDGGRYKVQPRVLVLCEDKKSSKTYFEEASVFYRSHAKVKFAHAGKTDPLGIVRAAIGQVNSYESIYCVIDRDTHANFDEAIVLAKDKAKVVVLPSFPCFEYWLLLHFHYSRAPFQRVGSLSPADCVVKELQKCEGMGGYSKGDVRGLFRDLEERLDDAKNNARRALQEADAVGDHNPSTRLHLLIDILCELGTLQEAQK